MMFIDIRRIEKEIINIFKVIILYGLKEFSNTKESVFKSNYFPNLQASVAG